jgi:hypothetical protein
VSRALTLFFALILPASSWSAGKDCASLVQAFLPSFRARIAKLWASSDLGWKLAIEKIREGRPLGKISLTPLEVDTLEKLLNSVDAAGGDTQKFFEGLNGIATHSAKEATSFVQHMDQVQLLVNLGRIPDQLPLLAALGRIKTIDSRIDTLETLKTWTQAVLDNPDLDLQSVLKSQIINLSQSSSRVAREVSRLSQGKGAAWGAKELVEGALNQKGFVQWRPFMDRSESFSEAMAKHSRFRKVNAALINTARVVGAPFNVPGEIITLTAKYGGKKDLTLMGLAGVIAADLVYMYTIVDPVLDWVRESYTPSGRLKKEVDHALDQASQLQVEDLYAFREQHVNKAELDPRFRPEDLESANVEERRKELISAHTNFYRRYDFKKIERRSLESLREDPVIKKWIRFFEPSPDDPLSVESQNQLARQSESFLLAMHQLDLELVRYFNALVKGDGAVQFQPSLTLEPYNSERVTRALLDLAEMHKKGELGVGGDSTLRVGMQQVLRVVFFAHSSQDVLESHFGESRPNPSEMDALIQERLETQVFNRVKAPTGGSLESGTIGH